LFAPSLDQIVHGDAQRPGDGGQRLRGARALSRLDLRDIDRVDPSRGGQIALCHAAMAAVYANGVFTGQKAVRDFGGKGLAPLRSGAIVEFHIAQGRLGVPIRKTLIIAPRDDGERGPACVVENNLSLVHDPLLCLVNLLARSDAQNIDDAGSIIVLENDPNTTDAQSEPRTSP